MAKTQTNKTPEVLAKYEEVVRLRSIGLSFQQIADRVGYAGRSGAKAAYAEAIKTWGSDAVEEHRILENERLDYLWRTAVTQIEGSKGDPGAVIGAINSALRISARRAALNGLDSPRQVEIAGQDGGALRTDIGDLLRSRLEKLEQFDNVPRETIEISPGNDSGNQ
jgi:hypothetical protein